MSKGTYVEFRDALRAFESGWDRDRYQSGAIQDWQLDQWAGGPVTDFFPEYSSWADLTDEEWAAMSYRSMNSLGFVGYQFGEALLIDLGYYDDDQFYGNGATTNTWDGTWTGKNGVTSLEDFMTADAQEVAIQEAFGYNLQIIENGLAQQGQSLGDILGTTTTYQDNGQAITVTLTLTGIMAAAHLRGAYGTLNLLLNGSVSTDEYGTSILRYIDQFGGYDAPTVDAAIAYFEERKTGDEGLGGDSGGETEGGAEDSVDDGDGLGGTGNGTANVTAETADVVITYAWGSDEVITDFDPTTDTIFVSWISADALDVVETVDDISGTHSVVFSVPSNNQSTTLEGISLAELSAANFTILDDTAASEILGLIGDGSGSTSDGDADGSHEHVHVIIGLTTPGQVIDGFMPAMGDMIEIGSDIYAEQFHIFEEFGDALGQTVRIEIAEGGLTRQIVFTGIGLSDLTLANITAANQGVLNEVTAALGESSVDPSEGAGYTFSYDADGSNPPETTGATSAGGVKYRADSNADDITGFRPGQDELDFGGTSVHGLIITKSQAGEIVIDSPWSEAAQIVQGVTYQNVTLADFGIVGNEHLRQDMGGVISWEHGVGPREADTVYVRSHEYGVHEVVDGFDPTSMKISFLYFGTRERLSVTDTDDGLVISSLPSGQSVTLTGVTLSELIPGMVEFHFDQVMEDNLEVAFGFAQDAVTLVDRTMLETPEAPSGATTDGFQTRVGDMTGSIYETENGGGNDGETGDPDETPADGDVVAFGDGADSFVFGWSYGTTTTITGFDTAEDSLDFGSFSADQLTVSEASGDLIFEVIGNGGDFVVVEGITAEDLSSANLRAPDWSTILDPESSLMQSLVELGFEIA